MRSDFRSPGRRVVWSWSSVFESVEWNTSKSIERWFLLEMSLGRVVRTGPWPYPRYIASSDTKFASPSATRPVSGAGTLTNNMKCVRNNIHNFSLLPSFVLSFIYSYIYICIDPLLQIRSFGCGMNSYHQIVCEQFKSNWRNSSLTTWLLKTENTMWTLSSYIIRRLYCKR